MRFATTHFLLLHFALLLATRADSATLASQADHREFDATLHAPYQADAGLADGMSQARTFTLAFAYPLVGRAQDVLWRLELLRPNGQVVQRWHGAARLYTKPVQVAVRWGGRAGDAVLADGVYRVRMQALARAAVGAPHDGVSDEVVKCAIAGARSVVEQSWEIAVGHPDQPRMPGFAPMPTARGVVADGGRARPPIAAPAPASLPYTVYFGNLHSQTNHSDGGGALSSCAGAQDPQSAPFGPADAFGYAKNRGLDILMASEHNHMYDGSDASEAAASPAAAKALYQAGRKAAAGFSVANPGFLALYGLEWGVISNGGHLNIFNSPELLAWELNSSGQLIGDTLTAKGDYAGLYGLMRQRGWVG